MLPRTVKLVYIYMCVYIHTFVLYILTMYAIATYAFIKKLFRPSLLFMYKKYKTTFDMHLFRES